MDFTTINTKDAAEEGEILHVEHPVLGHLLYVGEGADSNGKLRDPQKGHEKVTMTVRGLHSESIQKARRDNDTKKTRKRSSSDQKMGEDLIDALIIDWSNVIADKEPLDCTRENKIWLVEQDPNIMAQIMEFAADTENFFVSDAAD